MRFDRIAIKDVGPFKSVDLDLSTLAGKLTAVTGQNGAGKTTLLELLAGGLYRSCPTRGTLASLATSRGASVEVAVTNGAHHVIRQTVDNISGKGETLVLDAAGAPVLDSAKVSAGDAWIEQHLPAADTLYASSFAVQGRRGFLDLSRVERKALLVELLGLKRYEAMAAEASTRAGSVRAELAILRSRLAGLPAIDLEALCAEALACQGRATTATESVEIARRALERARAAAGDAERARELVEQRAAVSRRVDVAKGQIADTETRIANNRALLNRSEEIRSAETRAEEIQAELGQLDEKRQALAATVLEETSRRDALAREAAQLTTQLISSDRRLGAAALRLRDRDTVALAAVRKVEMQGALESSENALAYEQSAIEKKRLMLLSSKDDRIGFLREGLDRIAGTHHDEDAPLSSWAASTLEGDDDKALAAKHAPDEIASALSRVAQLQEDVRKARIDLANAERMAARAGEMEAAERDRAEAESESNRLTARIDDVRAQQADAAKPSEAQVAHDALRDRVSALKTEREKLRDTVALVQKLEQATALLEERKGQLAQQRETLAAAERELAALPVVEAQNVDLSQYERDLKSKEQGALEANAAWTRAQDAAAAGEATLKSRAVVLDQIAAAETQLADYTRLAQDLGKDGLQLMEIDAALPELAATTNRLLHECCSTRFTVEIRTDRLSADGKRTLDGLDVVVLDTVNGREAPAETYSGGEVVLVGSALSLALTTLACRRSESEAPTLVLDEAGAALDAENGRAWIRMLRLAVEQIGASRCLFISHSPELVEMADSRIVVANGQAVVS